METKIKDFELKQDLEKMIEDRNPDKVAVIDDMALVVDKINTNGSCHFNLSVNATLYDNYTYLGTPGVQIKTRTYNRLKEDQEKHGFTDLKDMVEEVLEKHYDHD